MITKVILKKVASYKTNEAILETNKKVNLIYGLNGTGKSTFSKYFQNLSNIEYSNCSIELTDNQEDIEILVYNQKYIEENFYNSPSQKGIFSLSRGNKNAKNAIENANSMIAELLKQNESKEKEKLDLDKKFHDDKDKAIKSTWNIKTDFLVEIEFLNIV